MKIYVIIDEDRHLEPGVAAYVNREDAIFRVKSDYLDGVENVKIEEVKGFEFFASYGYEGQSIKIRRTQLIGSEDLEEKAWKYDQLSK